MAQSYGVSESPAGLPESIKNYRSVTALIENNPSLRIGDHVEHLYKAVNANDGLTCVFLNK